MICLSRKAEDVLMVGAVGHEKGEGGYGIGNPEDVNLQSPVSVIGKTDSNTVDISESDDSDEKDAIQVKKQEPVHMETEDVYEVKGERLDDIIKNDILEVEQHKETFQMQVEEKDSTPAQKIEPVKSVPGEQDNPRSSTEDDPENVPGESSSENIVQVEVEVRETRQEQVEEKKSVPAQKKVPARIVPGASLKVDQYVEPLVQETNKRTPRTKRQTSNPAPAGLMDLVKQPRTSTRTTSGASSLPNANPNPSSTVGKKRARQQSVPEEVNSSPERVGKVTPQEAGLHGKKEAPRPRTYGRGKRVAVRANAPREIIDINSPAKPNIQNNMHVGNVQNERVDIEIISPPALRKGKRKKIPTETYAAFVNDYMSEDENRDSGDGEYVPPAGGVVSHREGTRASSRRIRAKTSNDGFEEIPPELLKQPPSRAAIPPPAPTSVSQPLLIESSDDEESTSSANLKKAESEPALTVKAAASVPDVEDVLIADSSFVPKFRRHDFVSTPYGDGVVTSVRYKNGHGSYCVSLSWGKAFMRDADVQKVPHEVVAEYGVGEKTQSGVLQIIRKDVIRLYPTVFLNDTIIDVYLRHLAEQLSPEMREASHFFSPLFFKFIKGDNAWARIQTWMRNLDIFEKKYLFFPINNNLHWSLVIVANPGSVFKLEQARIMDAIHTRTHTTHIENEKVSEVHIHSEVRKHMNNLKVGGSMHAGSEERDVHVDTHMHVDVHEQKHSTDLTSEEINALCAGQSLCTSIEDQNMHEDTHTYTHVDVHGKEHSIHSSEDDICIVHASKEDQNMHVDTHTHVDSDGTEDSVNVVSTDICAGDNMHANNIHTHVEVQDTENSTDHVDAGSSSTSVIPGISMCTSNNDRDMHVDTHVKDSIGHVDAGSSSTLPVAEKVPENCANTNSAVHMNANEHVYAATHNIDKVHQNPHTLGSATGANPCPNPDESIVVEDKMYVCEDASCHMGSYHAFEADIPGYNEEESEASHKEAERVNALEDETISDESPAEIDQESRDAVAGLLQLHATDVKHDTHENVHAYTNDIVYAHVDVSNTQESSVMKENIGENTNINMCDTKDFKKNSHAHVDVTDVCTSQESVSSGAHETKSSQESISSANSAEAAKHTNIRSTNNVCMDKLDGDLPCIMLLDSATRFSAQDKYKTVRKFLQNCWNNTHAAAKGSLEFSAKTTTAFSVTVPEQSNDCDCGVFMLKYIEEFMRYPPPATKTFIESKGSRIYPRGSQKIPDLPKGSKKLDLPKGSGRNGAVFGARWFAQKDIPAKRVEILDLVGKLSHEYRERGRKR